VKKKNKENKEPKKVMNDDASLLNSALLIAAGWCFERTAIDLLNGKKQFRGLGQKYMQKALDIANDPNNYVLENPEDINRLKD
jgi:hypothetical protein